MDETVNFVYENKQFSKLSRRFVTLQRYHNTGV